METGIRVFFGKFAVYIIAGLIAISAVGFTGWYVATLKLEATILERDRTEARLTESNSSYRSIRDQFKLLTDELKTNQVKALENQAILQTQLTNIIKTDESRVTFEQALLAREPVTDCKTPKEVLDAWKRL